MNWAIKIISKTLMDKISHISWGVTTKAFTVSMSLNLDRFKVGVSKTQSKYFSWLKYLLSSDSMKRVPLNFLTRGVNFKRYKNW